MPEELVPPVVAVVVTSNPGSWFETCLESLRAQDYPNLSLLVVDDASETDVSRRVAALEPHAVVRRRSERGGFSAAANEALSGVEGETFLLFCHDDVELAPQAVRSLVEDAYRLNAGVVGPKVVEVDDPDRLVQAGLGMRRLGSPVERVELGERDQSQHDEAREVFAVPGGCMLVRADLFEALHGFDPAMKLFGEDVDFCWRAQIAGARVLFAPRATIGHRLVSASLGGTGEMTGNGDMGELRRRHELRATLKNYARWRQLAVVPELLALAIAESAVSLASGKREGARRWWRAWRWNVAERRSLRSARAELRDVRQVSDRVIVSRMERRGPLSSYLRAVALAGSAEGQAGALTSEADGAGGWWSAIRQGRLPTGQLVLAIVVLVVGIFGIRDLLFARLPLVGELVPLPRATTVLADFFSGRSGPGGNGGAPPQAFGVIGLVGLVLGNSTALALKAIEFGALAIGALGASRLVRPFGTTRARLVAAAVFVASPLCWNGISTGDVQAAVALGAGPFVLARLARSTGLAPFADQAGTSRRRLAGEIAPFGLVVALVVALAPAASVAIAAAMTISVLACLVAGERRAAGRVAVVSLGALLLAGVCCLPWSLSLIGHAGAWGSLTGAVPGAATSPASLLRGHTGVVGAWWGAFGLVAAASFALVFARRERSHWAVTWWLTLLGAVALAWVGGEGFLGSQLGATAVVVAPAGACVAGLCGLGVATFERDVVRTAFGWRHAAAFAAALCCVVGVFPALAAVADGRGELPSTGFDGAIDLSASAAHGYRVLWLGDPRDLPGSSSELRRGLAWYTTLGATPGEDQLYPPANSDGRSSARPFDAVLAAERRRTADAGSALASSGVRYVVVLDANAPSLPGTQSPSVTTAPPRALLAALQSQEDLVERPVTPGAFVFVNASWSERDTRAVLAESDAGGGSAARHPDSPGRALGLAICLATILLIIAEGVERRHRRAPRTELRQTEGRIGAAAPS